MKRVYSIICLSASLIFSLLYLPHIFIFVLNLGEAVRELQTTSLKFYNL